MTMKRFGVFVFAAMLTGAGLGGGCTTVRQTDPPRTATEQFLLSVAGGQAADQVTGDALRGRTAYVDMEYLSRSQEVDFMLAEMRAQLLEAGVRLVRSRGDAEVIVEVRSGGLGIDRYEFLLGLPALPLGAVAATAGAPPVQVSTPELALIKNVRQLGTGSVAYVAYWADTGELLTSSGPFVGRSEREDWWFFGWGPHSISNIPTTEPLE